MFDTDVLIWMSRGERRAAIRIDEEPQREMSIISWMELVNGARSQAEVRSLRKAFASLGFRTLPVNETISASAAALIEAHALGAGLDIPDALIAATAREHGRVLVTGNVKHFRGIAGLEVEAFRR
jgi:predicted nucleic acid-binding protein